MFMCRRGRDGMVVVFATTCTISAYPHYCCELESHSWRGVLDTTFCDKVCQWLATGRWFFPGTTIFSIDITEILLKVALNTITIPQSIPELSFLALTSTSQLLQDSF
jgi:hypothetical protein